MTWQHPRPHRTFRLRVALLTALAALVIAAPAVLAANATGVNVKLPTGFSIAGTVKTTGGAAIANATVIASGTTGSAVASSSATGAWSLGGLAAGTYKLLVYAPSGVNLVDGWYTSANANHFTTAAASATGLVVGPSKTGVAIKVPAGFTISGIVTNTSGTPLSNVAVSASATGYAGSAVTDATGKYTITGLAAGTYKLSLSPGGSSPYVEGWYMTANTNHFTTVSTSANGVVVGPSKTGINVKLPAGFTISGKLTTTGGTPLVSASVTTGAGPSSRSAATDASGNFKIVGLKAGGYTLHVSPPYGQNLQTGFYTSGNANRFTAVAASATKLAVGPNLTGLVIKIPAGYTISGKITGPTGTGLAYSGVNASGANGSFSAYTATDGTYKIIGLSAGTWKVTASAPYGQGLVGGWYTTANANHYTASSTSATGVNVGP